MQEEDQPGGDQRCHEEAELPEGGGRDGADDEVAEETAAEGGDEREHGDAEDVEVLAHGEQGARGGEDKNAREVQGVLDAGREEIVEHAPIVPSAVAPPTRRRDGAWAGTGGQDGDAAWAGAGDTGRGNAQWCRGSRTRTPGCPGTTPDPGRYSGGGHLRSS